MDYKHFPDLENMLPSSLVLDRVKVTGSDNLLQTMACAMAKDIQRSKSAIIPNLEQEIGGALIEREHRSTTSIGQGIALPNAVFDTCPTIMAGFLRLQTPLDFQAYDSEPVDLVMVLIAPRKQSGDHLRTLSRITRLFRNKDFCAKLRGADNADALYALLIGQRELMAA